MNFHPKNYGKLGVEFGFINLTNILFGISFHFGTVLGGLYISPQGGIKTTKNGKLIILTQFLDDFYNSKCFFQKHIPKVI